MVKVELNARGFGEGFSPIQSALEKGRLWSNGSTVQQIASHVVTPISTVAAIAINIVAQALLTVGKAVGFAFNAVAFVITVGNVEINASLTPSQIFKHAYRTAASVAFTVVGVPVSLFSSSAALNIAQAMGLAAQEAPVGKLKAFLDGIPAGCNSFAAAKAKVRYIAKEGFALVAGGVKCGAKDAVAFAKTHTVNAKHRNEKAAALAVVLLAYGAAAYKLDGITAPVVFAKDAVVGAARTAKEFFISAPVVVEPTWQDRVLAALPANPLDGRSYYEQVVGYAAVPVVGYVAYKAFKKGALVPSSAQLEAVKKFVWSGEDSLAAKIQKAGAALAARFKKNMTKSEEKKAD